VINELTSDVPLPESRGKYQFKNMKIGDSFFSYKLSARTAAMNFQKLHGVKFVSRREGDGIRIWRVA